MATPEQGLAAVAYAPSRVDARVRGGIEVAIVEETEYPFRGTVKFSIYPASPVRFLLVLRIPGWAEAVKLTVAGSQATDTKPGSRQALGVNGAGDTVGWFSRSNCGRPSFSGFRSAWEGSDRLCVESGRRVEKIKGEEPHADWEVYPATPWNYGLVIDADHLERSITVEENQLVKCPFLPRERQWRFGRRLASFLDGNCAGSAGRCREPGAVRRTRRDDHLDSLWVHKAPRHCLPTGCRIRTDKGNTVI